MTIDLYTLIDETIWLIGAIDGFAFNDEEIEMAFIVRKEINELRHKLTTAVCWRKLSDIDKDDAFDVVFDTKQKRNCYLHNEVLRWATSLYTDDKRCKGDAFFESDFFTYTIKPELEFIYRSLNTAKLDENGLVIM